MERDQWIVEIPSQLHNFNSHAHVERDVIKAAMFQSKSISTHTLTWSVTLRTKMFSATRTISTHTLTWSVTSTSWTMVIILVISTHTLTWSVTGRKVSWLSPQ